jgi:glutathione S-transferase
MLTLYGHGPHFGLPEPCPFVLKAMTLLRMAGVAFAVEPVAPDARRDGEVPLARDGDVEIADVVALADHLRRAHGVDLDAHLSCAERGAGWALERMLEDHLYGAAARSMGECDDEAVRQARRDFSAAAAMLGKKPFLFGERPASADAALFAFAASAASPLFESRIREAAEHHPSLVAHQWRMMDRYYEAALAE